jgi:hypothetical protein
MEKLLLIILAGLAFAGSTHATDWITYHDHDWLGYKITYPAFLHFVPRHLLHPDDDSGIIHWRTSVYASADGEEQLYFNFFPWDASAEFAPQRYFQEDLDNHKNDTITYSIIKDNWYVISGFDSNERYEFYTKAYFIKPKGDSQGIHASFTFTYPHEDRAKYDPMISVIAKGFIPDAGL